ncbi:MAG: DUF262 domain-containing protein [Gammaproteobacteria bacterium]
MKKGLLMIANNSIAEERIDQQPEGGDEGVEGLQESPESLGGYPIDKLLIRRESRTIYETIRRIKEGRYIMDPDFQRGFVWDPKKQSRLIESVIMRIPLPVFYLAEDDQGKMIVVDGLQRLATFCRFRNGELRLNLPQREELDGKFFDDLIPKYQNRIEDFNLTFYVIDYQVEDQARLDIFERVNSGEPLSRQQMRNALYSGPATIFLREEAESAIFIQATGRSLNTKTMRDREFVNRFCSFYLLGVEEYKGDDMDGFLSRGLEKMNDMEKGELEDLSRVFQQSLSNNFKIFGKHAFRKSMAYGKHTRRSVLNASLWDVMSTELAKYTTQYVAENKDDLKLSLVGLVAKPEFSDTITLGTGGVKKVQKRFKMLQSVLKYI